jgi:hypothetical protein
MVFVELDMDAQPTRAAAASPANAFAAEFIIRFIEVVLGFGKQSGCAAINVQAFAGFNNAIGHFREYSMLAAVSQQKFSCLSPSPKICIHLRIKFPVLPSLRVRKD